MIYRRSNLLMWFLLFFLMISSPVQADTLQDFLDEYAKHEEELHRRYFENRKVKIAFRYYATPRDKSDSRKQKEGELIDTGEIESISDSKQFRMIITKSTNSSVVGKRTYWSPSLGFWIAPQKTKKMEIQDLVFAQHNPDKHEELVHGCPQKLVVHANGYHINPKIYLNRLMTASKMFLREVLPLQDCTWQGQSSQMLTVRKYQRTEFNKDTTIPTEEYFYFDAQHRFISLGMDTQMNPSMGNKRPHKLITEIKYRSSDEGFPIPLGYRRKIVYESGQTFPHTEWDILAYEKYIPDPEEFRLEKEFGLPTPIAPELPLPSKNRSWPWWLLVIAIILGLSVYIWRRKYLQPSA